MIICCGESLIDMISVANAGNESVYAGLTGGAIFNTSIALGRLDVPVGLISGVSTDLFGEKIKKDFSDGYDPRSTDIPLPWPEPHHCEYAAGKGYLDCLQFLHKIANQCKHKRAWHAPPASTLAPNPGTRGPWSFLRVKSGG